ncbi:MAG: PIN domain nuclease, partial [Nitrospirae bacterium]
RYFIDTSVWIEFFRKKEPWYSLVAEWIDRDMVCYNGLVYAELLQGAKSEREIKTIREFVHVFDCLEDLPELWEKAGMLSYRMRRKGKTIGLADCYISVVAEHFKVVLVTLDRHFRTLKKELDFALYKLSKTH